MTTPNPPILYHAGGLRCQREAGEANGKLAKHGSSSVESRRGPTQRAASGEPGMLASGRAALSSGSRCGLMRMSARKDAEAKATEEEQADRHGDGSDKPAVRAFASSGPVS